MKHPLSTSLYVVCRFILLGMLIFSFLMGDLAIARAQGEMTKTGGAPARGDTLILVRGHDDDCDDNGKDDHCDDDDNDDDCDDDDQDDDDCAPRVRVTAVWTADERLNPKSSFTFGDTVQWVITIRNRTRHTVSVKLIYDVKDPSGKLIHHSDVTVSAKPGLSEWPVSGVVPNVAGTYSFKGSAKYRDSTTRRTTKYNVSASQDSVVPAAITDLTATSGTATGTVDLSWTAPGDDNDTGTADSYLVRYSTSPITDEATWNAATPVTTGVPAPSAAGSAETITVTGLTPGTTYFFAIRAEDEGSNMGGISNSPSAIAKPDSPLGLGPGIYDDTHPGWTYTGTWDSFSGIFPFANNTKHYTFTLGDEASFTFEGVQFVFIYTQFTDRGDIEVYVDGNKLTTINANGPLVFQKTYTSPVFPAGTHVVQIRHGGGAGYTDVDAIQVLGTPTAPTPGVGIYTDTHPGWTYTGTWTAYSGGLPFTYNTMHYTGTLGDEASFTFEGVQFVFIYTQNTNRGNIDVIVDGNKVDTINANGPLVFQKTYTSPVYPYGTHLVQFRNAGGGEGFIDVDAIHILAKPMAPSPGAGIYDDTNPDWTYTGAWTAYSNGLVFLYNTMHYTGTLGDEASFTFEGTKFILVYTQNTNRGSSDVYVDGNKVTTVNANGPLVFQQVYISPVYPSGTHVVEFRNSGGSGDYIDIDAIQIAR